MTIKIERRETDIVVSIPHCPTFGAKAKALGGTLNTFIATWSWLFPHEREEDVRELCREVYGHDGDPGETVTCRVAVPDAARDTLWGLGRRLAWRKFCPTPVELGPGVSLVRGGFAKFGGRTGPALEPHAYTVLEVRDVPVQFARREAAASGGMIDLVGESDVVACVCLQEVTNDLSDRVTGGRLPARIGTAPDGSQLVVVGDAMALIMPGFARVSGPADAWSFDTWIARGHNLTVAEALLKQGFGGFLERKVAAMREELEG